MNLSPTELTTLAEQLATALETSDQALKMIQEDASRGQKERLSLIEKMAAEARRRTAPTVERLAAIRSAYGTIE